MWQTVFAVESDATPDDITVEIESAKIVGNQIEQSTLIDIPAKIQQRNSESSWMNLPFKKIEYGKLITILHELNTRTQNVENFLRSLLQIKDLYQKNQKEALNHALQQHIAVLSLFAAKEYMRGSLKIDLKGELISKIDSLDSEKRLITKMNELISLKHPDSNVNWAMLNPILNNAIEKGPADYQRLTTTILDLKRYIAGLQRKEFDLSLKLTNQSDTKIRIFYIANLKIADSSKKRWEILEPMKLIHKDGVIELEEQQSQIIKFNSFENAYYKTESVADNIYDPDKKSLKVRIEIKTIELEPRTFKTDAFLIGLYQVF